MKVVHEKYMTRIDFGLTYSKVKATVTLNATHFLAITHVASAMQHYQYLVSDQKPHCMLTVNLEIPMLPLIRLQVRFSAYKKYLS